MTGKVSDAAAAGRPRDLGLDERIRAAALELFLAEGVDGLSFARISKHTGLPRSSIYRRWKTRGELLDAALQSARVTALRDPQAILRMTPEALLRFLEDTLVAGLMSPLWRRLLPALIGAAQSYPELLGAYVDQTLAPGWRLVCDAIDPARQKGAIRTPPDLDMLRDVVAGAIIYRMVTQANPSTEAAERSWAKRLMVQTGLCIEARRD